ncbi:MAG TPA: SCP2 sterol-binding domain-containing protein [Mycobacteriales bacterium]|jgi:hypothetical protein|nr:SCP2 sterol-binding domain-containing protein [Mycobacteriales bacterium]
MATIEECETALRGIAAQMQAASAGKNVADFQRAVSCFIPDLAAGFHAQLMDGTLRNITEGTDPAAQITLTVGSDDLVALANGELNLTTAWATSRLKLDAGFMDLMKLRTLM